MNAPGNAKQALLIHLETLALCPRAEGYACITARREHGARSVDVEQPGLAIVLQGRKRVHGTARVLEFVPGDLFLMARRCRLDVVNTPDPASGLYLTLTIPLCEEVIDAARLLWVDPVSGEGEDIARLDSVDFRDDLLQWCASLQAARYIEARVALTSLVVALCRRGHTALLAPPPPSLAARLRRIVSAQPGRGWQSRDFEQALGLSGATLRRHLSAEGTGLREVIASARLACAMDLLYTTRWPIKTVASRVGYRSTTSFVRRFTQRYGLDPAQIGNA